MQWWHVALTALGRQGLQIDPVPAVGQFVALRRIETTAWGGVYEDVTATIHPENLRAALAASALCGLEVAGVDMISCDITERGMDQLPTSGGFAA